MAGMEFDESFLNAFKEVVTSDRLADKISSAIHLDNESCLIKPNKLREFIYKLNRVLLKWLCDLNRVNFIGASSIVSTKRQTFSDKLNLFLNDKSRKTSKKWPKFLFAVWLICMALASFNAYFFYIYDANKAKLQKLQEHINDRDERDRLVNRLHLDVEALRRKFKHEASQAREYLMLFGGSYTEWSFTIESLLVLLGFAIDWVVAFPISHQVGNSVWLSVQAILDLNDEHETRFKLILAELEHFRLDSLLFTRVKSESLCRELARTIRSLESGRSLGGNKLQLLLAGEMKINELIMSQRHRSTMEKLQSIALEGRLNPTNRTPMGRDMLTLVCLTTLISYALYTNATCLIGNYQFHSYFKAREKPLPVERWGDSADALDKICLWILIEFGLLAGTLANTIMMLAIYEQLETSKHLRAWICHVINANELRYRKMMNSTAWKPTGCTESDRNNSCGDEKKCPTLARDMELDLLTIIIQCRLTMRAFLLVKRPLAKIASLIANFAILVPIVFCIHSAYVSPELKLVTLSCCLAVTIFCLSCLALLSLVYRRSIIAFGTIWSLVAQLSYFESVPRTNKHLMPKSDLTLFILRRQLADMEFTMDKFAIRWLTMPITYTNLIRIFSWTLFFMMAGSILSVRLFGEGLGSILADPFGLFAFLRERPSVYRLG